MATLLHLFAFVTIVSSVLAENRVIVSVLGNDAFLLPAKVLAYQMKMLNMTVPYVLLVTENVSNSSISELLSHDVNVRHVSSITSPMASKGTKNQYTRIKLWAMTEYDAILYLDLDVLPVRDLTPCFLCGSFCAIFRHSDKFNSGVLVLKPNLTVYEDLLAKAPILPTYDGGDQGFLNSYFDQLKFTPTFDHTNPDHQKYPADQRMLSSEFNYDIGMYYLNGGKFLVEPAVIHYTMGPTKPWLWWTYPLFDLNEQWSKARTDMESAYNDPNPDIHLIYITIIVAVIAVLLRKLVVLIVGDRFQADSLSSFEDHFAHYVITWISFCLAWHLVPKATHPFATWIFFIVNMNMFIVCLGDILVTTRCCSATTSYSFPRIAAFTLITTAMLLSLLLLFLTPQFGRRALLAVACTGSLFFLMPFVCKVFIIGRHSHHLKYQLLPVKKD